MKNFDLENICLDVHDHILSDRAMVSPIYQTSSFCFKDFEDYKAINGGQNNYTYTRDGNPTFKELENKIAKLEKGQDAKLFASGMAAISGSILANVASGDHIVVVNTVYGTGVSFLKQIEKFGITHKAIHVQETKEIFDVIQENTKMIYFESPSSQKFEMLDLQELSHFCKARNIITLIDNTYATPLLQNPIEYGIDIVCHSLSKFIGGHSDIVGGVCISSASQIKKIDQFASVYLGATISPMNAFLALRGLRTLPIRLKHQEESVLKFIDHFKNNQYIEKIYHPSVNGVHQNYLKGHISLLAIVLKDVSEQIIKKFVDHLEYFSLAYSWGGFESLVLPVYKGNNKQQLVERGLKLGHFRI